jgi:hypothetical protein
LGLHKHFFGQDPKSTENKSKSRQCDDITLKSFYTATEKKINRVKRQPIEWEKIFPKYTSDKDVNMHKI